ncbi:hypothetical protein [Rhodococcus sp. RD6.2]|nr:hypothetical protein [Rhodococcus sp. RD6.2]
MASLLISSGADIKTVQARMTHAARIRLSTSTPICGRMQTSPPALRSVL